jgi:dipeptidyl aminopeptidase/acylaminoacyl peptidase
VVDLRSAQSTLLFEDTQITGHSPQFSPNGNRIAIFATNPPGILIHDFVSGGQVFIESMQGLVGNFSPDSTQLIYPVMVRGAIGSMFYSQLEAVDLVENRRSLITGSSETPIEDSSAVWRPGKPNELAVTRRYLDDRYTDGPQVYLLNIKTNEATPLVVDPAYTHGALQWSPDGNMLVIQRFNRVEQGARPQIWTYNLQTQELQLIADDAYLPEFVP